LSSYFSSVPTAPPPRPPPSLHDALPIFWRTAPPATDFRQSQPRSGEPATQRTEVRFAFDGAALYVGARMFDDHGASGVRTRLVRDRKSTRLNSSHEWISYAVFCLKKKKQ